MALIKILDVEEVEEIAEDATVYLASGGKFVRAPVKKIRGSTELGLYVDEDGDICQE